MFVVSVMIVTVSCQSYAHCFKRSVTNVFEIFLSEKGLFVCLGCFFLKREEVLKLKYKVSTEIKLKTLHISLYIFVERKGHSLFDKFQCMIFGEMKTFCPSWFQQSIHTNVARLKCKIAVIEKT